MSVEDFIIYVYCCVEDICRTLVNQPLRSRGFMPKLSDAEVITMEIVGEFIGKDHDKGIWRYFRNHWYDWFPNLGSRANFAKQSANLWDLKRRIQDHIAWQIGALENSIHLVDGFPMPVCKYARASGSRCFKGEAGFSYCAAKDEKYYGFEGHIGQFRRNYLWLCLYRRECGRTGCAAGDDRRSARLAHRGQRLYPSQPKARIGTTRT